MDLKAIKVFVLVAKTLSFARTAELLYISPSSVSKYINQLESDVGRALFYRDTRRVELTDYGKALLPYAEKLWKDGQAFDQFVSLNSVEENSLNILFGMSRGIQNNPPVAKFIPLLRSFSQFRDNHKNTFIQLSYLPEGDLIKAVVSEEVQVALIWDKFFINNPAYSGKVSWSPVVRERRYVVFSEKKYPNVQLLEDLRFVCNRVIFANHLQSSQSAHLLAQRYFDNVEVSPCATWAEILLRVIAEEGVGFIEASLVSLAESVGLRCIEIDEMDFGCDLCIVWKNIQHDPEVYEFIQLLSAAFAEECEL